MSLGVAGAAYEAALDWSRDRVQGGVPIYRHQLVAHDLGRMRLLLDAAHSYLMRTAWEYSWSPPSTRSCPGACGCTRPRWPSR